MSQDPDKAPDDIRYDADFQAFEAEVQEGLIPKLVDSACTVSLVPRGETDVKFAVELGMSIMLDKPILAIVQEGTSVPKRLLKVADRVIVGDMETSEGIAKLQGEIQSFLATLPD